MPSSLELLLKSGWRVVEVTERTAKLAGPIEDKSSPDHYGEDIFKVPLTSMKDRELAFHACRRGKEEK